MVQLSIFDVIAAAKIKSPIGTYFVMGKDGYKRTPHGWLRLEPVYGPPKYGYRNLRDGWGLMQPDYIGSHWAPITALNATVLDIAYAEGEMEPIDSALTTKLPFHWNWQRIRETRDGERIVSETPAPGGMMIRLKKIPGRKVKWIYAFDAYSSDGRLFTTREMGLWCGMLFFGTIEIAQGHLAREWEWRIADTQQKFRDADSGRDFGWDRSWDKSTDPALLARKIIQMKKCGLGKPLEPEETVRLLELNELRRQTGRFDEDHNRDLSLDHLFAELFTRFLVSGTVKEDVWGDGPRKWLEMGSRWCKGCYAVQPGAINKKDNAGRFVVVRQKIGNGPYVRGLFKSPEAAMKMADQTVFAKTFSERYVTETNADFSDICAAIVAAGRQQLKKAA